MDHFERDLIEPTFEQFTKSQHEVLGRRLHTSVLPPSYRAAAAVAPARFFVLPDCCRKVIQSLPKDLLAPPARAKMGCAGEASLKKLPDRCPVPGADGNLRGEKVIQLRKTPWLTVQNAAARQNSGTDMSSLASVRIALSALKQKRGSRTGNTKASVYSACFSEGHWLP